MLLQWLRRLLLQEAGLANILMQNILLLGAYDMLPTMLHHNSLLRS